MAFKKFRADSLFNGYHFVENSSVLIIDENGSVEAILPAAEAGDDVQEFKGILSPGLINCHCHLELSHLKNVIPPHTGLIDFLCSVVTKRGFDPAIISEEMIKAEKEMYDNGIVAVGDIGNTADTADIKSRSRIRWQNFVEVLGFTDEKAVANFNAYKNVADTFERKLSKAGARYRVSIVPHAPYSISPHTFTLINEASNKQIISIHNQEHPAEDILYKTGGGDYLKLFAIFGMQHSPFPITGKSSIRSYLPHFDNGQTLFLVHNTYMPEEDLVFANDYAKAKGLRLVYCLCVNANFYIEGKLPPVEQFIKHGCHIVLGTDSYSSNWQLSITKEMETLLAHPYFKNMPEEKAMETVLQWATINGAKALQWEDELGSFEKEKSQVLY